MSNSTRAHRILSKLNRRLAVAFAAFTFIAAPSYTSAQTQLPPIPQQAGQANTYTLQVKSQAVVLDVVVTDTKGKVISNLTQNDFQVFEDKAPQKLLSFEAADAHPATVSVPVTSTGQFDKAAPNAPAIIVVLDEINTRFEDEAFSRYSLKKYFDNLGDTLPLPIMLVAVDLDHFNLLHDYTTSKRDLLAALDHHQPAYPFRQQAGDWKAQQFNAAVASVLEVAQATAGHAGRKGLIWVGRGFPLFDASILTETENAALEATVKTCTNALRDARIVLYTLDPSGVPALPPATDVDGFSDDDPFGGVVDFKELATATGGASFFGRNDIDKLIAISARDTASFYTLSYDPHRPETDHKPFHNIRVALRDPNLHAATREGYYTQADIEHDAAPLATGKPGKLPTRLVYDLTVAAQSTMVYDGVGLTISRTKPDGNDFTVQIDAANLPWQANGPNRLKETLTLLVESFDRKGKQLSQRAEKKTVTTNANPQTGAPIAAAITLPTTAPTDQPAARLRFIVRTDTGKLGATNVFLIDEKSITALNN